MVLSMLFQNYLNKLPEVTDSLFLQAWPHDGQAFWGISRVEHFWMSCRPPNKNRGDSRSIRKEILLVGTVDSPIRRGLGNGQVATMHCASVGKLNSWYLG